MIFGAIVISMLFLEGCTQKTENNISNQKPPEITEEKKEAAKIE